MKFSQKEIKDLFFAWILISLAFAILFSGPTLLFSLDLMVLIILGISAITAGMSFLLHELMHKYMAQKYGLWAEFRAFYPGLWIALFFSFLGFIFAAPGAVVSKSHRQISIEKRGKISLAGPLTNIILGLLFFAPSLYYPKAVFGLFNYGLAINALLAAFNLIPLRPFDGKDIYDWNKIVYAAAAIIAVLLLLISFII
jgi:Zn-dependent protease